MLNVVTFIVENVFRCECVWPSISNFQARLTYFGAENVIEWVCYVTAILFVIDFTDCQNHTGMRLNWQWQVGAVSVTMSWLNLLSNVRKFPFLGIYVVMFSDVLQTFLRFSIVCTLFVIAFSLGFYALFVEQVSKWNERTFVFLSLNRNRD